MNDEYTLKDLARVTGVSKRNILIWMEREAIEPMRIGMYRGQPAKVFDFAALIAVTLLGELRELGMETSKALPLVQWVQGQDELRDAERVQRELASGNLTKAVWFDGETVRTFEPADAMPFLDAIAARLVVCIPIAATAQRLIDLLAVEGARESLKRSRERYEAALEAKT